MSLSYLVLTDQVMPYLYRLDQLEHLGLPKEGVNVIYVISDDISENSPAVTRHAISGLLTNPADGTPVGGAEVSPCLISGYPRETQSD